MLPSVQKVSPQSKKELEGAASLIQNRKALIAKMEQHVHTSERDIQHAHKRRQEDLERAQKEFNAADPESRIQYAQRLQNLEDAQKAQALQLVPPDVSRETVQEMGMGLAGITNDSFTLNSAKIKRHSRRHQNAINQETEEKLAQLSDRKKGLSNHRPKTSSLLAPEVKSDTEIKLNLFRSALRAYESKTSNIHSTATPEQLFPDVFEDD